MQAGPQTPINKAAGTPVARSPQADVAAALEAARAAGHPLEACLRPQADDNGTVALMARRDLDAALQLLAERAQYITGANGAAIALRREGKDDMLCRASVGENAPELGALFSTEVGLSGESVRARQPLRCDDTQLDQRVNREVCRELGIASVVVMPVVHDEEVVGVFELFSETVHAFGERDLLALKRLSHLVETAVRLAHAAESAQGKITALPAIEPALEVTFEPGAVTVAAAPAAVPEAEIATIPAEAIPAATGPESVIHEAAISETTIPVFTVPLVQPVPSVNVAQPAAPPAESSTTTAKKSKFWSAAMPASASAAAPPPKAAESASTIPPVMRSLAKCAACGFPVSHGRELCVECEEKKWRGVRPVASAVPASKEDGSSHSTKTALRLRSGQAESGADGQAAPSQTTANQDGGSHSTKTALRLRSGQAQSGAARSDAQPELILSAGIEPERSFLSRNKYVIGAILAAAAAATGVVFLYPLLR